MTKHRQRKLREDMDSCDDQAAEINIGNVEHPHSGKSCPPIWLPWNTILW